MTSKKSKVLIVMDMQRDFMPGGPLGISGASFIIPLINSLMDHFDSILAIRDWHPIGHISFATTHGKRVGEVITVNDTEQILWPEHCVQETRGANLADGLKTEKIKKIFSKGSDPEVDSYSAFFDSQKKKSTGLEEYLKKNQVKELYFVGVATDFCILYSVLDAIELGFKVTVILDACRAINRRLGDEQRAIDAMQKAGAHITSSTHFLSDTKY